MSERIYTQEEQEAFTSLYNTLDERVIEHIHNNNNSWFAMSYDDIKNLPLNGTDDTPGSLGVWRSAAHVYEMYDEKGIPADRLKAIQDGNVTHLSRAEKNLLADKVESNFQWFNNNSVGMAKGLQQLWGATPQQLASFAYLADVHSNTGWGIGNTWGALWRQGADPLNYATLGAGAVAKKGGQMAFMAGLKKLIQNSTAKQAVKFAVNTGAKTGATEVVKTAGKIATSGTAQVMAAQHIVRGQIGESAENAFNPKYDIEEQIRVGVSAETPDGMMPSTATTQTSPTASKPFSLMDTFSKYSGIIGMVSMAASMVLPGSLMSTFSMAIAAASTLTWAYNKFAAPDPSAPSSAQGLAQGTLASIGEALGIPKQTQSDLINTFSTSGDPNGVRLAAADNEHANTPHAATAFTPFTPA